jgi:HAD superfamily hydrolase (TIGR01490 family)
MRVAYFDLDKTLLCVNTGDVWFSKMRKEKRIKWRQFMMGAYWMLQYRLGRAKIESQIVKAVLSLSGLSSHELREEFSLLFYHQIRNLYRPGALRALALHREQSDRVVLLTSAPDIIADIITSDLNLDGCLCTRLQTNIEGRLTGQIDGVLCYGEGKVIAARAHAKQLGHSLEDSFFYTDSFTDLPLLKVIGNPIVVNPDLRLLRFAKKQNWPIKDWGIPDEE